MGKVVFKSTSSQVPPPELTTLYSAGDVIFEQGQLGTEMYIIHEGQVEIVTTEGENEAVVATLEKGDFFGEMALLDDHQPLRSATARVVVDTKLLTIDGTTFSKMLRQNPEIAIRMIRKFARRLRETDELLRKALGKPDGAVPVLPTPDRPPTDLTEGIGPEKMIHEESNMEFPLAGGTETLIGRSDPVTGIQPDVDLSPVDAQRSCSRKHAKIYRRGDKYFLVEEIGTVNGTFAEGERLETGVPREIEDGEVLRFGVVNLRFHTE